MQDSRVGILLDSDKIVFRALKIVQLEDSVGVMQLPKFNYK